MRGEMEMKNEKQMIYLDKAICRSCTHLVGELGTKTKSCTIKKGNTKCPAQWYKIEVGVDTEQAIEDFYVALQSGDITKVVAALNSAQANPKISAAVIGDLQDRLFEVSTAETEGNVDPDSFAEEAAAEAEEDGADLEEDEDEDAEA
jgi:hypothetical protein